MKSYRCLPIVLLLTACFPKPDSAPGQDVDGDDYSEDDGDCDDHSAAVHPDATERCNGIDDNCDGETDEATAVDATTWYLDADGDGYGDDDATELSCNAPSGYVDQGGDCLPDSEASNPGATEIWYDGVDQDCDGADDYDADADGYDSDDYGGSDCDDTDADVSPDAVEVWYDGVDGDCAGDNDYDADGDGWLAEAYGGADCDDGDAGVATGSTWFADVDGDGYGDPDSSIEACSETSGYVADDSDCDDGDGEVNPGAVEVCGDGVDDDCDGGAVGCAAWGTVGAAAADVKLVGEAAWDQAGSNLLGAGDINGDGWNDLLVAAVGEDTGAFDAGGAVYLVYGPVTGTVDLADSAAKMVGEAAYDQSGSTMAILSDTSAGGPAFAIGAGAHDGTSPDGAVYLVLPPVSGLIHLADADAIYHAEATGDNARLLSSGGDWNGDLFEDLVIGASQEDSAASDAGAVYVIGNPLSTSSLSSPVAKLLGEAEDDYAGHSIDGTADVDGDGVKDLLVGAFGESTAATQAGACYVVLGPVSGSASLADADAKLLGEEAGDRAGLGAAVAGDVTGDGVADIMVGAYTSDMGGTDSGAAYLVSGDTTGIVSLASATAVLIGEAADDQAGSTVVGPGDVDGNGYADVFVSAPKEDSVASDAGAAYLVLGPFAGSLSLSDADAKLTGESGDDIFSYGLGAVGDLDGDGLPDLGAGAPSDDTTATAAGAAYIFFATGY